MELKTEPLSAVCEAIVDCPHSTPKWTDHGFIVLRNQNIRNGKLDLSSPSFTNAKDFEGRRRRATPRAGDLVITREAPMGEVCLIPEGLECCLGQRQVLLRPKSDVDPRYLLYALQSPFVQHQISWNEGTGSTVSNVRIPVLKSVQIPRLDHHELTVAETLGTLDDKIKVNRAINRTLEGMAQAIFKSWFVDFDPVKAKMAARESGADPTRSAMAVISGKNESELDTFQQQDPKNYQRLHDTAQAFPDALVDSELGMIPEGWGVSTIGDVCKVARGGSPRPIKKFMGGTVPWVKIADATASSGPHIFKTKEFVKQEGVSKSVLLEPGALILSNSATCGIPKFLEIQGCIHDGWLYFRDYESVGKYFLYFALGRLTEKLVQVADGTVQKNLNIDLVSSERTVIPTPEIHDAFVRTTTSVFLIMKANESECASLTRLRDSLLPKLLSGGLALGSDERVTSG